MGDVTKDKRFSHIANDPRFKTIPRSQRRVKIDKRFESMFKDKRFKLKYTVDKRGRPISRTSNEDLNNYYELSSGDSDSEDEEADDDEASSKSVLKKVAPSQAKVDKKAKTLSGSDDEVDSGSDDEEEGDEDNDNKVRSDDEELTNKVKSRLHDISVDYARGEGAIMSDSSSSDEESSDSESDESVDHGWGELDRDAEKTDEITPRLAVCNMDWDRIRAVDLMVLLNSFTPPGGLIRSVTIYPSEFGLERMKKEEEEGPPELVESISKKKHKKGLTSSTDDNNEDSGSDNEKNNHEREDDDSEEDGSNDDDDNNDGTVNDNELEDDENAEGSTYHMEKLRQYQLKRLKYFYAIVECDSASTANHIYTECDGMEYESSATRLDLRFVPNDTTFDQEPKDRCSEMPDASKYRPRHFTNTALQQAKVKLTWDETDPSRTEIADRLMAGETVDDDDLKVYLASSSGEEDSEEEIEKKAQKEKKLNGVNKSKKGVDAESDSEGSGEEDPIAKYRSLLSGLEEEEEKKKNKGVHMEISWGLGIKEKAEESVKKRMSNSKELTPFQQMMEKRKQKRLEKKKEKLEKKTQKLEGNEDNEENLFSDDEIPSDIDMNDAYFTEAYKDLQLNPKKKKGNKKQKDEGETEEEQQRKAELELLLLDKDEPKHFNFKKIQEEESGFQSKTKKKKLKRSKCKNSLQKEAAEDDFKINVDDKRFSALFSSHHYNIDPTDPHFRKSNAMETLISTKQKRLANASPEVSDLQSSQPSTKRSKKDVELSLLVKSVKNKAQKLKKS